MDQVPLRSYNDMNKSINKITWGEEREEKKMNDQPQRPIWFQRIIYLEMEETLEVTWSNSHILQMRKLRYRDIKCLVSGSP